MELEQFDSHGVEPKGVSPEDLAAAMETLYNVQLELAFVTSKLNGEQFLRKATRNPRMKKWLTNNMLLIVCLWQLAELVIIALCELAFPDSVVVPTAVTLGCICQITTLVFILVASVKLGKQLRHRTATGWFLAQAYLCTIVLYAGFYTLLYQISSESFRGIGYNEQIGLFVTMLYFSVTTMTTVGFGDIAPIAWWSMVLVLTEALLSVVFTTVIFAKGLAVFTGQLTKIRPAEKTAPSESTPLN